MTPVRYHPLVDMDTEGTVKVPMFQAKDAASAVIGHEMYLEEVIPHYFRLCSAKDMTGKAASGFEVRCPYCGASLKRMSPLKDGKRHSLLFCKNCTKTNN
ncbi:MAG: hypothetical protein HUJ66_04215 [Oscillospiraceae bacterium]|nr:hypothetical protein [Oscillospiraceae bacterium]